MLSQQSVSALEVVPALEWTLTLDELAEAVEREHQLVVQAGASMVEHAIRAGEALLAAKNQVPRGQWEAWTTSSFPDKHPKTLRLYMRLAKYQDRVRESQPGTITAAHRLLAGEPVIPVDEEQREKALHMRKDGATYREIAEHFDVTKERVLTWINPRYTERRRTRLQQQSRAARRALHRQQRDAAARRAGGSVAEAYSLVRKALQALDGAVQAAEDKEAKQALNQAIARLHAAEDAVVRASKLS
jgi:hypothetical protein